MAVLCGIALRSHAADRFWKSTSGGNFSTSSNWQSCGFFCNPVPDGDDVAHFGLSDPSSFFTFAYTVTFSNNPTTRSLVIENDIVTFDLNGRTYSTVEGQGNVIGNVAGRFASLLVTDGLLDTSVLTVGGGGGGGFGHLTIAQGGRVQSDFFARIGSIQSNGTVRVDGGNSQWIHDGELSVGWGGTGTMNILGGALVQNGKGIIADAPLSSTGPGTVTVSGTNSRWINSDLFVGNGGDATLNIGAGGLVESASGHVSFVAGHTGAVTVDGFNARWVMSGDLFVGDIGSGTLNITGGHSVVVNAAAAVGAAAGSSGAVIVSGASSQWVNLSELNIGHSGVGTLDLTAGGSVRNTNAFIGRFGGSEGEVNVNSQCVWTNTGDLTVGNDGDGELNITSGGFVQNLDGIIGAGAGSTGSVAVTGSFANWSNSGVLRVGEHGNGTLDIEAGGNVTSITGVVGNVAGSVGTATIDGVGSIWTTSGNLGVGNGSLTISNGGAAVTNGPFGTLADSAVSSAEVTVVGQGSSWTLDDALFTVGDDGAATLNILEGGIVSNLNGLVGADMGSTGTVLVSGAGSDWINLGNLTVGDAGLGTLTISDGGQAEADLSVVIGQEIGAVGEISVNGASSLLSSGGSIIVGGIGGSGTLTVANGGVASTASFLAVSLLGRLQGDGTILGNVISQGVVAPGTSPGALHVTGNLQLQAGTLEIELAGTTPGSQYDQLVVSGDAGLDGTLKVSFTDGFAPTLGMSFDILDFGSLSGTFDTLTLPALAAGLAWDTSLLYTDGILSLVSAAIPGDYNFDGMVDAADYVVWRKSPTTFGGDPDGYDTWRSNYGEPSGSGSIANTHATVPEPATMALILLSLLVSAYGRAGRIGSRATSLMAAAVAPSPQIHHAGANA